MRGNVREVMFSHIQNKALFEQAQSYAYSYLNQVYERPVFPTEEALSNLAAFDESIPEQPGESGEILRLLHEYGSPATVAQSGGRYFGFVNGGAVPVALAARWLADVWDQNLALSVISPIGSHLESVCERWLVEVFGLPEGTAAGFVSGTSTATICGLAAARNELLKRVGWDVNSKGLFNAPPLKIVVGAQAHATVFKALSLLGFGRDNVILAPADEQGRIIIDELPELDSQTIVVTQAGNVNSGSFDPIDEICDRANTAKAWVHVDGAFGLWSAASKTKQHLTAGIEKADSWSVDAHKTLNAPYDNGIILCRRREALVNAMQATGSYIQYGEKRDGMLYTPEMSRRARAVELWATLKFFGRSGIQELVDGLCERAQQFAVQLQKSGFRILNDIVFNQVLVACDSPELTHTTLEHIQQQGMCWCGGAVWKGEPVIRISVCSWATTVDDINCSVEAFIEAHRKAEANNSPA